MLSAPTPSTAGRRRLGRWAVWSAVAAVLVAVFLLYAQPGFVVMLADQVWSCF